MSEIVDQNLQGSIYLNGPSATTAPIFLVVKPYFLKPEELSILNSKSPIEEFSGICKGAAVGFFVNILAKFFYDKLFKKDSIDRWEIFALIISIILAIIFIVLDKFIDNERRNLLNSVKEHFIKNQK